MAINNCKKFIELDTVYDLWIKSENPMYLDSNRIKHKYFNYYCYGFFNEMEKDNTFGQAVNLFKFNNYIVL